MVGSPLRRVLVQRCHVWNGIRHKSTNGKQPCITFRPSPAATNIPWNYTDKGPSKWNDIFPKHATGRHQSPVELISDTARYNSLLKSFSADMFIKKPDKMLVSNSGKSLAFEIDNGYTIPHPFVPFECELAQFHFHWGSDASCCGSEHVVDGKQYFAELHAVHYNTKYNSLQDAVDQKDGLCVTGVFIEASGDTKHAGFTQILKHMDQVKTAGSYELIQDTFSPGIIFPSNLRHYFCYKGSLTTPMFNESAHWILFKQPIIISNDQAEAFSSSLHCDNEGCEVLRGNFRPVQPLNERLVEKSFE